MWTPILTGGLVALVLIGGGLYLRKESVKSN